MAVVYRAVLGRQPGHVAVGTGEERGVRAPRAEIGLKLGVLHLDLLNAGAGVGPVGEGLAGREVRPVVEEGQNRLGSHARQTAVRDGGRLGVGREIILVVALTAGEIRSGDLVKVLAHRVDPVGVGHGDLTWRVRVTGVAGNALDDLRLYLGPILLVRLDALLVHHVGEVGRLAGPAVGEGMRTAGGLNVLHVVEVAAGGAVVDGKAVALVQRAQIGVLLQIIHDLVVLAVLEPGLILERIRVFPVLGVQYDHTGLRLDLVGGVGAGGCGKGQKQHDGQQQRQSSLHGIASCFFG